MEHIRSYQLHLTRERKVKYGTFNVAACALRFFFNVTLQKGWDIQDIPYQKTGRRLPEILSQDELVALFAAVPNFKHRVMLMVLYAGGLRLSEMLNLRVTDIDSKRMQLRIRQGKGLKDRVVMLSEELLSILRQYWKLYRPTDLLFPSAATSGVLNPSAMQQVLRKAVITSGIRKRISPHSLRHAFATHLLESGTNIRGIQPLLGHRSLNSTAIYTHVAKTAATDTRSPLDSLLGLPPAPAPEAPEPELF